MYIYIYRKSYVAAVGDGRFNGVNGFPTDDPTLGKVCLGAEGILEISRPWTIRVLTPLLNTSK